MSDLSFNKFAGAALATGLAIFGLRELTTIIFAKPELAKAGYKIAVVEDTGGGGEAADVMPDWGTVLPAANVAAGQEVTSKCKSCHNFDAGGPNQTGPNLYGALGRKPGTHPGFAYSSAMTDFGGKTPVWDYAHLYEFLKGPQNYINGTKMTFVGLKQPQDRINVIAYLRTLNASPVAIPAPNPKAAAAAAASSSAPAGSAGPALGATPAAAASGTPSVVASGGTSSNAGSQTQAPKSGAAAAPTQVKPNPGH